jgi:lysyl-tRNA synthetase class II
MEGDKMAVNTGISNIEQGIMNFEGKGMEFHYSIFLVRYSILLNFVLLRYMTPKRHIVWSTNEIDLTNPFQRKWYIEQVLQNGKAEDIKELDWDELKELLPSLNLPADIKDFWQRYLNDRSR